MTEVCMEDMGKKTFSSINWIIATIEALSLGFIIISLLSLLCRENSNPSCKLFKLSFGFFIWYLKYPGYLFFFILICLHPYTVKEDLYLKIDFSSKLVFHQWYISRSFLVN